MRGHTRAVTAIVSLPDRRIVSASYDGDIRIWNPDSGECRSIWTGQSGAIYALILLSDGRLASGGDDNTIKIWYEI